MLNSSDPSHVSIVEVISLPKFQPQFSFSFPRLLFAFSIALESQELISCITIIPSLAVLLDTHAH
jgi:hypothetical protein